jgi:hypothetical protein
MQLHCWNANLQNNTLFRKIIFFIVYEICNNCTSVFVKEQHIIMESVYILFNAHILHAVGRFMINS